MTKLAPSQPLKTDPAPNFFSTHSVLLSAPFEEVVHVLGRGGEHDRVGRLSPLCTKVELSQQDHVRLPVPAYPDGTRLRDIAVRTAKPEEEGVQGTEDSKPTITRQHFEMEESVPVLFGLFKTKVRIKGTVSWDENAFNAAMASLESGSDAPVELETLYESETESTGILTWKIRTFERVLNNGDEKVKVSERIEGWSPTLIRWVVESKAAKTHRGTMAQGHSADVHSAFQSLRESENGAIDIGAGDSGDDPTIQLLHFQVEEKVLLAFVILCQGTPDGAFAASVVAFKAEDPGLKATTELEPMGISAWLRTFERVVGGGQEKTPISETIEGYSPALIRGRTQAMS
ncbi:hypothetical protein NLJ89_g10539 [Agrocybe chaxingu]|uniref:Uncharacterized protein n=1 Tax=Agrocybe chaxingu TaxID=84603 RepID=A0A9W8MS14_9AGAR|nr:hypothetical protein NLJ89_g10539 [Agrocybe chaxingu]